MTDKDELFKGIDEAANSLFDQYIVKKPEKTPAAPPEQKLELGSASPVESTVTATAPAPEPRVEDELELELEFALEPEISPTDSPKTSASAPDGSNQIFGEIEEALLTIDWEVTQENILKGRESLAKLVVSFDWPKSSIARQVAVQMDKVLASMLASPENFPTSAPSLLKNSLDVIKENHKKGEEPGSKARKKLEESLANLKALLSTEVLARAAAPVEKVSVQPPPAPVAPVNAPEEPSFDLGLEMDIGPDSDLSAPGEPVPGPTIKTLNSYDSVLAEAIKLLTPMENLFASRPAMAKLHSAAMQLKTRLIGQQKLLSEAFSSGYSSYSGLGTVHGWLGSQLDVLKGCVSRIGKLEKLFGKTAGYEKLFTRSKKIRQILEKEVNAITVAVGGTPTQHQFDLTGEYPAIIQPKTHREREAPAAVFSAVASPVSMIDKCISLARSIEADEVDNPQNAGLKIRETLEKLKISISGAALHSPSATAAASSALSVAGHSTKCHWDWLLKTTWGGQLTGFAPEQIVFESKSTFPASSFVGQTSFKLKKLKSMPWTNLRGMFTGELAELENSELNKLELGISLPPASFPGSSKKKVYMIILYSAGQGKVYLVDSPTEAISVSEEALWSPGTSQADIAGTLTVYGSTMPVISLG